MHVSSCSVFLLKIGAFNSPIKEILCFTRRDNVLFISLREVCDVELEMQSTCLFVLHAPKLLFLEAAHW